MTLGVGIATIIYLPWLINLPGQFGKVGRLVMTRDRVQPIVTLWALIFAELPVTSAIILIVSMLTLALLTVFLLYRAWDTFRYHRPDRNPLALLLYLTLVPMLLMWLLSQWRPVYLTRALLPSALMAYIALAWLMTRARLPRPLIGFIAIPWTITILLALYARYTWTTFPRPPFDAVDRSLVSGWQAGSRIVPANKITT